MISTAIHARAAELNAPGVSLKREKAHDRVSGFIQKGVCEGETGKASQPTEELGDVGAGVINPESTLAEPQKRLEYR